ncbi:MAG: hypothetical protein SPJ13_05055 [Bacteroidales bacterium]|nr:hypothetical protein [Bacteroidales bacterium]
MAEKIIGNQQKASIGQRATSIGYAKPKRHLCFVDFRGPKSQMIGADDTSMSGQTKEAGSRQARPHMPIATAGKPDNEKPPITMPPPLFLPKNAQTTNQLVRSQKATYPSTILQTPINYR